jgi:general stress protein YciG
MARLRDQGLTLAAIGTRLGVTRQCIKIALDRLGYGHGLNAGGPRGFAALDPERRREIARLGLEARRRDGKRVGFALLTPERHRAVSAKGGRVSHALGKAHRFTAEEARRAGRKGGTTTQRRKRQGK